MNNQLKKLPNFASEAEERKYWETHDSSGDVDWKKTKRIIDESDQMQNV